MLTKRERRLYEVFQKLNGVNLDEYRLNEEEFNVDNNKDNRNLHVSLSSTGIEKFEEEYPEWVFGNLETNGFVEYDERTLSWFFTEEGQDKFPSPQDLKNWLLPLRDDEEEIPDVGNEMSDIGEQPPRQQDDGGLPELNLPLNEGVLNEEQRESIIKEFVNFANKHLGLEEKQPNITISQDPKEAVEMRSFGLYTPHSGEIRVVATNRNLADVLRTLAHEMVHFKQHCEDRLDVNSGGDGSDIENEANAEAAVMMRQFGRNNPIIFE